MNVFSVSGEATMSGISAQEQNCLDTGHNLKSLVESMSGGIPPKGPCAKGLHPAWVYLEAVETFGSGRACCHWGHALGAHSETPSLPLSLYRILAIMYCLATGPKAIGPSSHGMWNVTSPLNSSQSHSILQQDTR
jgi:hypothetical protein